MFRSRSPNVELEAQAARSPEIARSRGFEWDPTRDARTRRRHRMRAATIKSHRWILLLDTTSVIGGGVRPQAGFTRLAVRRNRELSSSRGAPPRAARSSVEGSCDL